MWEHPLHVCVPPPLLRLRVERFFVFINNCRSGHLEWCRSASSSFVAGGVEILDDGLGVGRSIKIVLLSTVDNEPELTPESSAVVISDFPVLVIVKELHLVGSRGHELEDVAGEDSGEDGIGEDDDEADELTPPLSSSVVVSIYIIDGLVLDLVDAGDDDRNDGAEDGGHAVKVINATGVMDSPVLFQVWLYVVVTSSGDETSTDTDEDSNSRVHGEVGNATDADSTSQGGVLNIDGTEHGILVEE